MVLGFELWRFPTNYARSFRQRELNWKTKADAIKWFHPEGREKVVGILEFDSNLEWASIWKKQRRFRQQKMDCKRKADDVSTESENPNPRRSRRPRILFAVTGSVAAVKGPEIAVRLVTECNCDVRILLTRGGENFWNKAEAYDTHYWDYHLEILKGAPENLSVVCKLALCYRDGL